VGTGPKLWTEELIAERVKNGRGRGEGEHYLPWLYVQEFSSRGTQTRIPCMKFNRTIHTFSYLERALFLWTEFQPSFRGYKEQFAQDRGTTLGAAKMLGIRHPRYPRTGVPVVMTIDAVVTTRGQDGQDRLAGWDVKPERQLKKARVLEKLSLHKAYAGHVGMPHYLFTENSIHRNTIRNIDWIRMALQKDGELEMAAGLFTWRQEAMLEQLAASRTTPSISQFCAQYDGANGLERGTGIRVMKLLLWAHRVQVNLKSQWIEREAIPRPAKHWYLEQAPRAA
jgi:hypothetical protein